MIIREIIMWLSIMRHNLKDFPEVGSDNKIKALSEAIDIIHKYQLMQADYNARLKADMVAMLTEIQLEIEELKNEPHCCEHYIRGINNSSNVIQQKIDKG